MSHGQLANQYPGQMESMNPVPANPMMGGFSGDMTSQGATAFDPPAACYGTEQRNAQGKSPE